MLLVDADMKINIQLKNYIEKEIIPQYSQFDKAHRINHAEDVIKRSLELAQYYEVNINMVYAIAAFHDLGLIADRKSHHIKSKEILLMDEKLRQWFDVEEINIMADAVEDHRASLGKKPRTIYGCIVAEADRLIEPYLTLERIVQYTLANFPQLSKEEGYQRMVHHLNEKYSETGYLKLWIPESINASNLRKLWQIMADEVELRKFYEEIYTRETTQSGH